LDLELEPLALADRRELGEAEARQRPDDGLALRVQDLGLGHDLDDDASHGGSLARVFGRAGAPGSRPTSRASRTPGATGRAGADGGIPRPVYRARAPFSSAVRTVARPASPASRAESRRVSEGRARVEHVFETHARHGARAGSCPFP